MALNRVVLPAPLGPITAETWLAGMPIDASSSATTPPKRTVSDLASSARPSVMTPHAHMVTRDRHPGHRSGFSAPRNCGVLIRAAPIRGDGAELHHLSLA